MRNILVLLFITSFAIHTNAQSLNRVSFNDGWSFHLGDSSSDYKKDGSKWKWRKVNVPHDWSIELPFDKNSPAGIGGGALPGGVGWYLKAFVVPAGDKGKVIRIGFDGIYCNSEVWINGHFLGKRPNGYSSFEYDVTDHVKFGAINKVLVKADNSRQPNSRWYSGSGIYRNTWITTTDRLRFDYNGVRVTTKNFKESGSSVISATASILTPGAALANCFVEFTVQDAAGKVLANSRFRAGRQSSFDFSTNLTIQNARYWTVNDPYLYKLIVTLIKDGKATDKYAVNVGLRDFRFDIDKGFFLNDQPIKIRGVCNHHDLGCLGTAVNRSALRRQLEILKAMGCNGIRTSHNPPAPELLDLCDEMGFLVMNESFDMWARPKNKFDYHRDFNEWSDRDLADFIIRDRNHPSVVMWSLGNEIPEQWSEGSDSSGAVILRRLHNLAKKLDPTRPTMTANNEVGPWNKLLASKIADINGYNYNHHKWDSAIIAWPGKPFIVTESVSALQTRGHYDFPADSLRIWPARWDLPVENANADHTCSAFDNCRTPWGSTHEESLIELEKYPHVSGMFAWTGFDYLGEPTPYGWPSRSSYFGIIDLAGFPKDVYYLYQSIWTDKPVLHLFPHWNWKPGTTIDVWAYFNQADEVELYLNDVSMGVRRKNDTTMHVSWKVLYRPGTLKAVSRKNGKVVLEKQIHTAGPAASISGRLYADSISAVAGDLAFITFSVVDEKGNLVPDADQLLKFNVDGGEIVGVDNGYQASLEPFVANYRKAYNGLCLAVVRPVAGRKEVRITATSPGLKSVSVLIHVK